MGAIESQETASLHKTLDRLGLGSLPNYCDMVLKSQKKICHNARQSDGDQLTLSVSGFFLRVWQKFDSTYYYIAFSKCKRVIHGD